MAASIGALQEEEDEERKKKRKKKEIIHSKKRKERSPIVCKENKAKSMPDFWFTCSGKDFMSLTGSDYEKFQPKRRKRKEEKKRTETSESAGSVHLPRSKNKESKSPCSS